MEKIERKQLLTVSVDKETAETVRRLAVAECDGNVSQATRRLIKVGASVMRAREDMWRKEERQ